MRKIIFCTVKTRCSIIEAVMKEEKNMKKMKRISDAEFHKLDLEPYKQEPEDEE